MKSLVLFAIAVLCGNPIWAKKVKFETEKSAIAAIQEISSKYWDDLLIKDKAGMTVVVSMHENRLVFSEKTIYKRPAIIGKESFSEQKEITTEIDLSKAIVTHTLTNAMFVEQSPKAIHQIIMWDTKALDNSDGYPKIYTIPLDYKRINKETTDLQNLKDAIAYLSKKYQPSPAKKKFSMKVGH